MRLLRLGRMFDGVLIHDTIMYMSSEEDLRAALVTAYEHCKPGGVVVIAPDWVAETFRPRTAHDGGDAGRRGRGPGSYHGSCPDRFVDKEVRARQ